MNLTEKLKNNFYIHVKPNRQEFRNSILTCFRGSIAHGMYVPSTDPNSFDDVDIMSVCLAPKEFYLGLDSFGNKGTIDFWQAEWDVVCYELKKFTSLMEKSNPNVLSMLWCDDEYVIDSNESGKLLRENRMMFSTQNIYHSFCGYAYAQLEQMTRNQCLGYMGEKRKSLVQKYGYDTKNAAHLIRLLRMGIEFLDDGILRVSRKDKDELLSIKHGKFTLEEIKQMAGALFEDLKIVKNRCALPPAPSRNDINSLLIKIIESEFYKK